MALNAEEQSLRRQTLAAARDRIDSQCSRSEDAMRIAEDAFCRGDLDLFDYIEWARG